MDYNGESLANLLKASGVTRSDVARVLGVSRVTVHNWSRGGAIHKMIEKKAQALFAAIASATDAGDLPIKTRSIEARRAALTPILAMHLAAVKARA